MYKTIGEIRSQCAALNKTAAELDRQKGAIRGFFDKNAHDSVTFIGCGSSFCVARSAAAAYRKFTGKTANAVCAGDLFLNLSEYKNELKNTILVSFSRSGSTSEVVYAVNKARETCPGLPYLAFNGVPDSPLSKLAQLNVELPWAVDESVCQTSSVSNMYFAGITLAGVLSGDDGLIRSMADMARFGGERMGVFDETAKKCAQLDWTHAVVLADGVLEGIAEEAALAFKEICMAPSNYYHLLDFRHGPIVLINNETLVILALSPHDTHYQTLLIKDVKKKGATVLTIGGADQICPAADFHLSVPESGDFAARGLPLLFAAQLISFHKAVKKNINPDLPVGLDPWIKI